MYFSLFACLLTVPCLQQDKWQAEMDHLVEQLLQSSAAAVDKLAEALHQQMQLSQQQRNAEKNQDKILQAGQKVLYLLAEAAALTPYLC